MRCVICVFCLLGVLVRLLVPVQVIDWKDNSEITYNVLRATSNPTHSLIHSFARVRVSGAKEWKRIKRHCAALFYPGPDMLLIPQRVW